MTKPTTLGRGLGRAIALATLSGMLTFGVIVAIVINIAELGEECSPGVFVDDPPKVILLEIGVALAFAAPVGFGLSLAIGRTLTRRTTTRLDQFIASAPSMTGRQLEERLPVAHVGDAFDRLAIALNGAFERIERGVAEQRQFSANASHELRTPLAVIAANLEVAQRKPRDVTHCQHVANTALSEVRRMATLVDKLLVLSRAGAADGSTPRTSPGSAPPTRPRPATHPSASSTRSRTATPCSRATQPHGKAQDHRQAQLPPVQGRTGVWMSETSCPCSGQGTK